MAASSLLCAATLQLLVRFARMAGVEKLSIGTSYCRERAAERAQLGKALWLVNNLRYVKRFHPAALLMIVSNVQ